MNSSDNYFPYPIISNHTDDYGKKKFEVNFSSSTNIKKWDFALSITLEDEALKKHLQEKNIKYLINIESRSLGFRKIIESFEDNFNFDLDLSAVSKRVEISTFIVAQNDLKLTSNNFDSDYAGRVFNIEKGNILGMTDSFSFIPEDDSREIKDVGSIIAVDKNPNIEVGPIEVKMDSENIVILLSAKDYKNYNYLDKNTSEDKSFLISLLVIPSLQQVLNDIQNEKTDGNANSQWEDRKWYKVLMRKISTLGFSENPSEWESSLEIIQKIIENQISFALQSRRNDFAEDDED